MRCYIPFSSMGHIDVIHVVCADTQTRDESTRQHLDSTMYFNAHTCTHINR